MLLSIQQRFILDTLKKLNCVRRRQLHALVRGRFQQDGFEITQARMDAMLRQLRAGTADVRMDDGLVWLSNAQPDARRLEAIEVMLDLTGGQTPGVHRQPGTAPSATLCLRGRSAPVHRSLPGCRARRAAGAGQSGARRLDHGQRRAPQRADAAAQALLCRPPAGRLPSLLWLQWAMKIYHTTRRI